MAVLVVYARKPKASVGEHTPIRKQDIQPKQTARPAAAQPIVYIPEVNHAGVLTCWIGGILSVLLGCTLHVVFPWLFTAGFSTAGYIFTAATIYGGAVSIVGGAVALGRPRLGRTLAIIGGLISGVNFITLIGAAVLFKKPRALLGPNVR